MLDNVPDHPISIEGYADNMQVVFFLSANTTSHFRLATCGQESALKMPFNGPDVHAFVEGLQYESGIDNTGTTWNKMT
jgi:hypothetical protein